ncbi:hypothetical protein BJF82_02695 [Kytococcus sp. CUA-901]|nr:hypothetical protein BJF82_02695 [Kytococcus sp. CUA-901]
MWRARGEVVVEAARPAFRLAFSILLPLSIGVLLLGLVAAGVAVVRSEPSAAVAAAGAFALAIALAAGAWWARRAHRTRPGRVWVVSRQGITIDGVGPVPGATSNRRPSAWRPPRGTRATSWPW